MTSRFQSGLIAAAAMAFLGASTPAFAASPTLLQAVLTSKEVSTVTDIEKVEVVATYRCPNCHDLTITGHNPVGPAYIKVHTSQMPNGPLTITVLEQSK